jgi:hypothetical protein
MFIHQPRPEIQHEDINSIQDEAAGTWDAVVEQCYPKSNDPDYLRGYTQGVNRVFNERIESQLKQGYTSNEF